MRRAAIIIFVLISGLVVTSTVAAQEEADVSVAPEPAADEYSTHVIGATASFGMATAIVENCSNCSIRFAGGGGAHYNFYLTELFGLHAGVGFMGRGLKASGIGNQTDADEQKIKVIYLDVPLGIKLRFSSFQLALGVSLDFALSGKMENPDMDFNDQAWETWARRFNLGGWLAMGWAIHAGPIDIVPGFSFNAHILDEATRETVFGSVHPMNIMGNLGVEFGL